MQNYYQSKDKIKGADFMTLYRCFDSGQTLISYTEGTWLVLSRCFIHEVRR